MLHIVGKELKQYLEYFWVQTTYTSLLFESLTTNQRREWGSGVDRCLRVLAVDTIFTILVFLLYLEMVFAH